MWHHAHSLVQSVTSIPWRSGQRRAANPGGFRYRGRWTGAGITAADPALIDSAALVFPRDAESSKCQTPRLPSPGDPYIYFRAPKRAEAQWLTGLSFAAPASTT